MQGRQFVTSEFVDNHQSDLPTHHNFVSKVGKTYGNLSILKYAWKTDEHCYICRCTCGLFVIRRNSSLSGNGNISCGCIINKSKRIPIEDMKSKISNGLTIVECSQSVRSVWKFCCHLHGTFNAPFQQVAYHNTGCPSCAVGGYNKYKSGFIYIFNVFNSDGKLLGIKYGITNSLENRKATLTTRGVRLELIFSNEFDDGEIPFLLESLIKKTLGGGYISRKHLPNGFTETLPATSLVSIYNLLSYVETLFKI